MTDLTHEQIDEMEAGREMDLTVSELMFGKTHLYYHCPHFDEYGRMLAFCSCPNLHRFTADISAAWEVDKEDWYWNFFETPNYLQVTLYPSKELWQARPSDFNPYPEGVIHVNVLWKDYQTKAQAYAFGRCRAALNAVIEKQH